MEIQVGDVLHMRQWQHCSSSAVFTFGVGRKSKDVALFLYLGTEPRDGTDPLDVERRLRQLGWVPAAQGELP